MLSKLLSFFGVESYIKIPGKTFDNLSDLEFSLMIDAHLNEGNDKFDESALTEFTLMKYKSKRLEILRHKIDSIQEKYKTTEKPDGLLSLGGIEELFALSQELKERG